MTLTLSSWDDSKPQQAASMDHAWSYYAEYVTDETVNIDYFTRLLSCIGVNFKLYGSSGETIVEVDARPRKTSGYFW